MMSADIYSGGTRAVRGDTGNTVARLIRRNPPCGKAIRAFICAVLLAPVAAIAQSAPSLVQQEPIVNLNPGIAGTYLGVNSIPQPNLERLSNGHIQIIGKTGSWGAQATLFSVVANRPYDNDGPMGGFWDPNYRPAYGGQDGSALFAIIAGRAPVGTNLEATYATDVIHTPRGDQKVGLVRLRTPLTTKQLVAINALPPNTRVEASGGYFAYLIASGQVTPDGVSLPPVSADGRTLAVDMWVRIGGQPAVGPLPPDSATVTIDALHQTDVLYGGWRVDDKDLLDAAMDMEMANVNNRSGPVPTIDLYDPNGTGGGLRYGHYEGVSADDPAVGQGVGVADYVATDGWQAGFVARNAKTAKSGPTYGFLAPFAGPTWAFYSTQDAGSYVLGVDPGNSCGPASDRADPKSSCSHSLLIQANGDIASKGRLDIEGSVDFRGSLTAHGHSQLDGGTDFFDASGSRRMAYVDDKGQLVSSGSVVSGAKTLAAAGACPIIGAHLIITDGRKPGEPRGEGSGVPADCLPPVKGAGLAWISVYDHHAVSN